MIFQSSAEDKTCILDDKSVSQEAYSCPSSSHDDEAVLQQEKETTGSNDTTQDKEAQIDARSTFTAASGIPPPPDGGLHAWLKVFGGFLVYINIWYVNIQLLAHPQNKTPDHPTIQPNHKLAKTYTGASLLPTASSNPTTARPSSHLLQPRQSPGLAQSKPGSSSLSACYPARSSTADTSAPCCSPVISLLCSAS
jgi:hypothetical protein